MMGKLVREEFKEANATNWRKENPTTKDIVVQLTGALATEARWQKAVQHMAENGKLDHSPKDIGPLIKAVQDDIMMEEVDWIKDRLFAHFSHDIFRGVARGLPDWYKNKLAASSFGEGESNA
jgi:hypothetical protein